MPASLPRTDEAGAFLREGFWASGRFLQSFLHPVYRRKDKGCRNFLLRQPLRCRGDWIRTSDLLNPIQAR